MGIQHAVSQIAFCSGVRSEVPQEEGLNQDSETWTECKSDTASCKQRRAGKPFSSPLHSTLLVQYREVVWAFCVSSLGSRATHLTAPSDTFLSQIVAQHRRGGAVCPILQQE